MESSIGRVHDFSQSASAAVAYSKTVYAHGRIQLYKYGETLISWNTVFPKH